MQKIIVDDIGINHCLWSLSISLRNLWCRAKPTPISCAYSNRLNKSHTTHTIVAKLKPTTIQNRRAFIQNKTRLVSPNTYYTVMQKDLLKICERNSTYITLNRNKCIYNKKKKVNVRYNRRQDELGKKKV